MSTISSFKSLKNKHDVYRGKDCMKKFSESLREHATKIILKRQKMKLLTKMQESYVNANLIFVNKTFKIDI